MRNSHARIPGVGAPRHLPARAEMRSRTPMPRNPRAVRASSMRGRSSTRASSSRGTILTRATRSLGTVAGPDPARAAAPRVGLVAARCPLPKAPRSSQGLDLAMALPSDSHLPRARDSGHPPPPLARDRDPEARAGSGPPARIAKRATRHTFRHSFATRSLGDGAEIAPCRSSSDTRTSPPRRSTRTSWTAALRACAVQWNRLGPPDDPRRGD